MIQPKSLYRLVKRTARLQREARRVVDTVRQRLDVVLLDIRDTAAAKARGIPDGLMAAPKGAEGLYAGPEWWAKWGKETDAGDGVAVYIIRPIEEFGSGRVAMLARSIARWLIRCGWVREATAAEIEAERSRAKATTAPRSNADIGRRLRTARSLHHALPDGQRASSPRHPPRRKGRERVSAH